MREPVPSVVGCMSSFCSSSSGVGWVRSGSLASIHQASKPRLKRSRFICDQNSSRAAGLKAS